MTNKHNEFVEFGKKIGRTVLLIEWQRGLAVNNIYPSILCPSLVLLAHSGMISVHTGGGTLEMPPPLPLQGV